MKKIICIVLALILCQLGAFSSELSARKQKIENTKLKDTDKKTDKKEIINEAEYESILVGALLDNPKDFIDKKIKLRGKFSSFTTLALDYEPALRKSKDYISLCIFRPDSKIPLSELKLAYPLKEAKENLVIRDLEEGDVLEIYGKVFSSALDEPWVDILSIKKIESAAKKEDKVAQDKETSESKGKSKNKVLKGKDLKKDKK